MVASSMRNLLERTGKSADEWVKIVKKRGLADEPGRREWLKTENGFTSNYASWIAELSVGKGVEQTSPEAYLASAEATVDAMFAGKRTPLRPIYDRLLKLGLAAGRDAKACPCKTIVPLYREHVFAEIKPATNTRIDIGFALGARKASGRLVETGGYAKKNRITHRIPITSSDDIGPDVERWLHTAYELDAPK